MPSVSVPRSTSIPYFFIQSSGKTPTEPSARVIRCSPRLAAASTSGKDTDCPPKSIAPPSSNQSIPLVTESLNSPTGWITSPSASTCQPSATSSRTTSAEPFGRQFQGAGVDQVVLRLPEADLEEADRRRLFGRYVSVDDHVSGRADEQVPGRLRGDGGPFVDVFQLAEHPIGLDTVVPPGTLGDEPGTRGRPNRLQRQVFDQIRGPSLASSRIDGEHVVLLLSFKEDQLLLLAQSGSPTVVRRRRRTGRLGRCPG